MPPMPGLPRRRKPPVTRRFVTLARTLLMHHHCDRCGHSKIDGKPISHARYRVVTPIGELFFCGNHFDRYREAFASRGYETYEVS